MATKKKMLQAAAGQAGGAGLDITEVFSTYLYDGTGSAQTITNGIDLSGEGGMVWLKDRGDTTPHTIHTTDIGALNYLVPHYISGNNAGVAGYGLTAFNSDGFSLGTDYEGENGSGDSYASWTFRKAPKFFDVVTYTGDGSNSRAISHNLGSIPGMVIIKRLDSATDWMVYHRGVNGGTNPANYYLTLNGTDPAYETASPFNNTVPTSSVFSVGGSANTNHSSGTYVAYLFAHNDGDGGFGPDGDQDIIKCGSYTGTGATDNEVDLGFEPQWLMIKRTDVANNWFMFDTMRGITSGVSNGDPYLRANLSNAEGGGLNFTDGVDLTATGFELNGDFEGINANGGTYIYMAIRRGPLAQPESGTEVFAVDANGGTSSGNTGAFTSGFPVDLALYTQTTGTFKEVVSRLNSTRLFTNLTNAENSQSRVDDLDFMDGYGNGTYASDYVGWMWKRAPSFFDVVAYTGGSPNNKQIPHNLGVVPELIIQKQRSGVSNWHVWCGLAGQDYSGRLNLTNPFDDQTGPYYFGSHTDTYFSVGYTGYETNVSGSSNIAYLFATLPGVSKVGSYTGTGATLNIDCGFTSGARFVLIKRTNNQSPWWLWDSERGIVAGNDPYLELNSTAAENTSTDYIDPYASGFALNSNGNWLYGMNYPSGEYIFYAIA